MIHFQADFHSLVVFAICIATTTSVLATGVVALRRDDVIVLAADSAVFDQSGSPDRELRCKIAAGPRVAMAFAGHAVFETGNSARLDSRSGPRIRDEDLDAVAIGRRVVSRAKTVGEAAELFPEEGVHFFRALSLFAGKSKTPFQAIIAGFDNGRPTVLTVTVQPGGGPPSIRSCPPDCPSSGAPLAIGIIDQSILIGSWQSFDASLKADLTQSALDLLGYQVVHWKSLGMQPIRPPFDVVEITGKGVEWKQRKAECKP